MQRIKNKQLNIVIGIGLLGIAACMLLRLMTLCFSADIWYDELFSMEFATRPFAEALSLIAQDVHPPLYYFIVRFFVSLGSIFSGDSASSASGAALAGMAVGGAESAVGAVPAASTAFVGASAPAAIICAKLASVVPFIILWILAVTVIRRRFGMLTGGIFVFAVVSMPQITQYILEVRMYGWALLFVTLAALSGYSLMECFYRNAGGFCVGAGARLLLFSILACYTHYYAVLSIGCLYVLLIVWIFVAVWRPARRGGQVIVNGRVLATLFVDLNLTGVAFLPWLFVLASQISDVAESYWILPLTWRSLGGCVKFLFKPAFTSGVVANIAVVALFLVYAGLLAWSVWRLKHMEYQGSGQMKCPGDVHIERPGSEQMECSDDGHIEYSGSGQMEEKTADSSTEISVGDGKNFATMPIQFALVLFGVLAGIVLAGFVASMVIRPIFVYRYMMPAMGGFWLCFAILMGCFFEELFSKKLWTRNVRTALNSKNSNDAETDIVYEHGGDLSGFVSASQTQGIFSVILAVGVLALFISAGIRDFWAVRGEELYKARLMHETEAALEEISEDTKIVCNFNQLQALMAYTYGDSREIYLIYSEQEPMIPKLYENVPVIEDASVIRDWLEAGEEVLFFGSFVARDVYLQEWYDEYGITNKDTGSYLYERYWFDIFELQ